MGRRARRRSPAAAAHALAARGPLPPRARPRAAAQAAAQRQRVRVDLKTLVLVPGGAALARGGRAPASLVLSFLFRNARRAAGLTARLRPDVD